MDFQLPSLPFFLATVLFILLTVKLAKKSKKVNLPPGPPQLPLIGNIHQITASPLVHHTMRDLARKYGPIMYLKLGELRTVVISSPEIAREVMKTHDLVFAQRPNILASKILGYEATGIAFSRYGEYWRQVRKICTIELLSHTRVQTFRPIREQEVDDFVREILSHAGEKINLSRRIFSLTFGITGRAAFGKKSRDQDEFMSLTTRAVPLLTGFSPSDLYPSSRLVQFITGAQGKLEKIHAKQDEILQNIVDEHRKKNAAEAESGEEDLVDVLLRIQKDSALEFPLTDDNIKSVISDIFAAGSETSSTTVEWAMSEMLKNPEIMKKAQTEVREAFGDRGNVDEASLPKLTYLQAVIKETLRLHSPVPLLIPRESREECEINGYVIPAQTRVVVNAWAIGRTYWAQAESFMPERFLSSTVDFRGTDFEFIPFGAGRRVCPAMTYAVANIQLPLAQMLFHFDWKFPDGLKPEELDMAEVFGLAVRRKNDLELIPVPYQRPSH